MSVNKNVSLPWFLQLGWVLIVYKLFYFSGFWSSIIPEQNDQNPNSWKKAKHMLVSWKFNMVESLKIWPSANSRIWDAAPLSNSRSKSYGGFDCFLGGAAIPTNGCIYTPKKNWHNNGINTTIWRCIPMKNGDFPASHVSFRGITLSPSSTLPPPFPYRHMHLPRWRPHWAEGQGLMVQDWLKNWCSVCWWSND